MTNAGLILLLSSATMAGVGGALYLRSRHSAHTSQGAALAVFSHGAFATAGLLFVVSLFHVHSVFPLVIHLHTIGEALADDFDCDLTPECVALSSLMISAIVLGSAALLGQISSRALLRQCSRARVHDPRLPVDAVPAGTEAWVVRDPVPDAFAAAVLRWDPRRILRVEDIIVVTTGALDLLSPAELRAVLAHEAAHVKAHDNRYLPFVRTLATLLFMDPVLGALARRLAVRYEFGADEDAAWSTRDPRSLARALLKMSETRPRSMPAAAILGGRRRPLLLARIERLLDLADAMEGSAS